MPARLLTVASRGTVGSDLGLHLKDEVSCDSCRLKSSVEKKVIVNMGRETPSSSFSPLFLPSLRPKSCTFQPPTPPWMAEVSGLSCSSDPFGTHLHKARGWLHAGSPPASPKSPGTIAIGELPFARGTTSPGATPQACSSLSNRSSHHRGHGEQKPREFCATG